ncbi:hypothetical protein [Myceligenerans halotolerans]
MRNTIRTGSPRVVAATAGAGLALALLTGGVAASAPGATTLSADAPGAATMNAAAPKAGTGEALDIAEQVGPPGARSIAGAEAERPAASTTPLAGGPGTPHDFLILAPGQSRLGLPPGVELDDSTDTMAGGAWTPAEGLLYVVTLGSSTCPRIAEPVAANTVAGTGIAADDEVGEIDVTLSEPEPGAVCTADWVPTTTVVAAPEGKDHGGNVSLRIDGVGKADLSPRPAAGEVGPPAWIGTDH